MKTENPKVSVLMTAYNREEYIGQAIESVLQSSFEDFELIIVDDQSKDQTVTIARSYEEKDKRVRVYENEENLGDYPNRNRVASYANGKYLKYLDADDIMYEFTLEYMVRQMESNPQCALGMSKNIIDDFKPYPQVYSPLQIFEAEYFEKSILGVGPSASIIRREVFEQVNGFSGRQFVGDIELWYKIAKNYPVIFFPPALVWWRQHPDQQIATERKDYRTQANRVKLKLQVLEEAKSFFSPEEYQNARERVYNQTSRYVLHLGLKKGEVFTAYHLWKNIRIPILIFLQSVVRRK